MADFEARVLARLDHDELDRQLQSYANGNHAVEFHPVLVTNQVDTQLRLIESRIRSLGMIRINLGGGGSGGRGGNGLDNITQEFNRLMAVARQVGNLEVKIRGLDVSKNASQITTLQRQLRELHAEYQQIYSLTSQHMDAGQFDSLNNAMQDTQRRLDELGAKVSDAKQKMAESINTQIDNGKIQSDISGIAAQYEKLSNTGHQSLASIQSDLQELQRLQAEMSNPQQYRNSDQLIETYERYNQTLDRVKNTIKTVSSESKTMATSLQVSQLDDKLSQWLVKNSKAAKEYGPAIQALRARLQELSNSGGATTAALKQIDNELRQIDIDARAAGLSGKSFGDSLKASLQQMTGLVTVASMMHTAIRLFKDLAKEVTSVDTAMTQLRIVTNATESEYRAFYQSSVQTAKDIGASVSDLINSSTTYARLGYSLDESGILAKYTGMLQNVGDIDVNAATSAITAITKAYRKNADEIESVMDKLVIVGNNAPISVSELAEGLNNAGSSLAAADNSFEQSVALLTAANTTVQNISKSSTGLRTLTARLRNTKTELDELGEAMTDAEYENIVNALTGHGVSLKDANGDLRKTYDIIKDIAAVWDDMSSMDQAALAKTLAGTRQQNVFYGLIGSFQEAEKAMQLMGNSAGTLSSSYDEFLDSIQGKINQLKAAWTELANTVLSSDFLKDAVDTGKTFLEVLNGITGAIGSLPTLIGGIAAAMSLKNGAGELIKQFLFKLYYELNMPAKTSNGNTNETILVFA